jgi:hypothetical protein
MVALDVSVIVPDALALLVAELFSKAPSPFTPAPPIDSGIEPML